MAKIWTATSAEFVEGVKEPPTPDFVLEDHGSIWRLVPESTEAKAWAEEHLPEDAMTFSGGYIVEPRYIARIVSGIIGDGLVVVT